MVPDNTPAEPPPTLPPTGLRLAPATEGGELARRLGPFDAAMIVMGGIIGSGIFINPSVVAREVGSPGLVLLAWLAGGAIALIGSFVYAELASRLPKVGGQYAYLREAYHPSVAFLFGWALLLVTQTGGMAAVAVTFAHYFLELTGLPISGSTVAVSALGILTLVNCVGVRTGSTVQNLLMVMKVVAIVALVVCGLFLVAPAPTGGRPAADGGQAGLALSFGAAMIPVLFAYGGWQTSNFIAGELRNPERDLPRGLLAGVAGVIVLYVSVNFVCVRALGTAGLAATTTPASEVMNRALGAPGARAIAIGIAISTLGFLSQGILTAPRVYFAMARDGLFFRSVAMVHPRTHTPIIAIALQGLWASLIAATGRYEQILNYVVSVDFIFFGLTATTVFVFRRRESNRDPHRGYRMPWHPWTTTFFIAGCWLVVLSTIIRYPANSIIGLGILAAGLPAYAFWRRKGPGSGLH